MPRKRYTFPEQVLKDAITGLELSDDPLKDGGEAAWTLLRAYHETLLDLLVRGPYYCMDTWLREKSAQGGDLTPEETSVIRAELLQLLRSAIRGESSSPITLYSNVTFAIHRDGARVTVAANGAARELIVLQFLTLLRDVGVASVRVCSAAGCGRIFLKTYRRTFCSARCQKRINAQNQRANKRQKRERTARARRLRKGQR